MRRARRLRRVPRERASDEESVESSEPGSLEPGGPDARRVLKVNLAPGRYVFFCNMEGHFMAGMHHEVAVG